VVVARAFCAAECSFLEAAADSLPKNEVLSRDEEEGNACQPCNCLCSSSTNAPTSLTSPRLGSPTPFVRPSSSAATSTWTILTFGLNFGGSPKCRIQFNLAPRSKITSASFRAVLLADDAFNMELSGTTPLPIGVGRNGILVDEIKVLMATSARAYAAPFPIMTRGEEQP
jgi:hypothetical protein